METQFRVPIRSNYQIRLISFHWHPKILLWAQGHRWGGCADEPINNQTTVIWVKQATAFIDYTAGALALHEDRS